MLFRRTRVWCVIRVASAYALVATTRRLCGKFWLRCRVRFAAAVAWAIDHANAAGKYPRISAVLSAGPGWPNVCF